MRLQEIPRTVRRGVPVVFPEIEPVSTDSRRKSPNILLE